MIEVQLLPTIPSQYYSVLHHLRRRGVFQNDGWCQLQQAHMDLVQNPGVSASPLACHALQTSNMPNIVSECAEQIVLMMAKLSAGAFTALLVAA